MRRGRVFQYRLLWKYRSQKYQPHELVSERPLTILKMLRRLCAAEPWMGATANNLRGCWAYLASVEHLLWHEVVDLSVREAQLRIQSHWGPLEWLRVEFRQVGPWVEMLDPLDNLKEPGTEKWDIRARANFAKVEGMTREELDNYRVRLAPFIEEAIIRERANPVLNPAVGRTRSRQQGASAWAPTTRNPGTDNDAR
jgi:hypothetical protein